jgi:hypothetical protein
VRRFGLCDEQLRDKSGDKSVRRFERIYGPEAVSRFNMLKSVNVNGKSNPGFGGDAIIAVQEVAAQHLPKPIPMSSLD